MEKDYREMILELTAEIIKHGYGELAVRAEKLQGKPRVKITVECGKKWVFFETIEIKFDMENGL